ncbi:MAG TPA: hypothetical protein QGG93_03235 [Verrucomicrobiota bacterium]|nr:hypothetical protein [Verrucomicrobiota bacterium]|tara:strand:- start:87 stop:434 length:348 start_codon:yes stop_codon:yes gene_type:complete
MKNAFATLLSCLLISSQLGLGMVLASQPAAAVECGHCPCGSEASCCEGDGQADQPLPALPQRQAKFQVSPVVLDGQASPVFMLPDVALEFPILPQPLQLKVAGVPVHKRICRYLT